MKTNKKYRKWIKSTVFDLPYSALFKTVNFIEPSSNKSLIWSRIIFGAFSLISSIASSYYGIASFLNSFINNELFKGCVSFFLVFIFIWGANRLLFDTWRIEEERPDFMDSWSKEE